MDYLDSEIAFILNEAGKVNFSKSQGSWGQFERMCQSLTSCGWKMGMCKSSSGKDNAINRMYTTGVIRSYPSTLIHCLFIDDFLEEMTVVYCREFGEKMRCTPMMVLVTQNDNGDWITERILVQDKHPLFPFDQSQLTGMFPTAEIIQVDTVPFNLTDGWE